jgi:hypothetical protein
MALPLQKYFAEKGLKRPWKEVIQGTIVPYGLLSKLCYLTIFHLQRKSCFFRSLLARSLLLAQENTHETKTLLQSGGQILRILFTDGVLVKMLTEKPKEEHGRFFYYTSLFFWNTVFSISLGFSAEVACLAIYFTITKQTADNQ